MFASFAATARRSIITPAARSAIQTAAPMPYPAAETPIRSIIGAATTIKTTSKYLSTGMVGGSLTLGALTDMSHRQAETRPSRGAVQTQTRPFRGAAWTAFRHCVDERLSS